MDFRVGQRVVLTIGSEYSATANMRAFDGKTLTIRERYQDGSWFKFVEQKGDDWYYGKWLSPAAPQPILQPQETTMSSVNATLAVQEISYIFGADSTAVSDATIFNHIKRLEDEHEALEKISSKPKALIAKQGELKAQIKQLVDFCDKRTDAERK
jgi:hypothetical protein